MNLSRNQKRYAYILGACALAFLVDRLFLSTGEAEAGEQEGPGATTPATATTRDPLLIASIPRTPLADRFATLAEERSIDLTNMSDPFQVPAEWYPDEPGATGPVVETDHPDVDVFRKTHRLNAVMALESGGHAIVDGRRLGIGQELDGFRLVEIRSRSIMLESRQHLRVELKLLDAVKQGGAPRPIGHPQ